MSFLEGMPAICAACGGDHYYHECGEYVSPTIEHPAMGEPILGGGFVPQQFEGNTADGRYFYFRNRHGVASLELSERAMTKKEFWDGMYTESHAEDCPVRGESGIGHCVLAGRRCSIGRSSGYRYAEISERSSSDVAYGGWPYDAEGQRQRNLIFSQLWDLATKDEE